MARNKKYKREYLDSIKTAIPEFYFAEDYSLSGYQRKATDAVVNSHINFCINQPTIFNISATTNYSDIDQVSGIGRWFIPTNNLTNITSRSFELDIMHPLGHCVGEYTGRTCTFTNQDNSNTDFSIEQKNTFRSFLESTLLPKITLNSPTLATTTSAVFNSSVSGTHEYLINTLGWAYFLNTSGFTSTSYSPSSYVASSISDLYFDDTLFDTKIGVKGLTEYVWRDWTSLSATYPSLLPANYVSGGTEYTSGTQNLEALQTLTDVIYSDQHSNKEDSYIKDAITDYLSTGDLLTGQELAAPFSRFMQGASYSFFDTNDDVSKLSNIYNIEKCPDNLLPYLADLIGWRLYGSSPTSWRRQIRGATSLYKQKGTKKGLHNALTTVLPTVGIQASSISEFYESYLPNLLYYLIKTDTTLFDSFDSFTYTKAQEYIPGDYDPEDMDNNIRKVVDWMLLKALSLFPELFYIKNFKFDINNPKFQFFYRDRSFPIPPWEEEKFYYNCDVTNELLIFFKKELICLGVTESNAESFRSHVADNTVQGVLDTKFYNNGFFFLTDSIKQPPNRDSIIDNFEVDKYDYFPLWNGKSSHFDVDVSSGSFDATFFEGPGFVKQDFFQALAIVDSFTPSKAIPRTRVNLDNTDTLSSLGNTCPSIRHWTQDMPVSGVQAGFNSSGIDFRGIPGVFGEDYPSPPNSSRARNNHADLPVFGRSLVNIPLSKANLMGSLIGKNPLELVDRTSMRRRDFSNTMQKGGLYTRTGFNMPSYFNTSSQGSDVEYQPLGLLNTIFKYHKVIDPANLYAVSSYPYNLDVWQQCWDLNSSRDMSGISASSTFDIMGTESLVSNSCNPYVARERTPEFFNYLYKIIENKFKYQADYLAAKNNFLVDTSSSFLDIPTSIKNKLLNDYALTDENMAAVVLGQRRFSRDSLAGIHKTYKDYINYYNGHAVGNRLLETQKDGGVNIISHTFGPLLYNANFTVEGSGVTTDVSSQIISRAILEEAQFSIKDLTGLNNITASDSSDLYVDSPEYRNPFILSGVEFTDASSGDSKFSIFNLDPSTAVTGEVNYLVKNPIVVCKPSGGLSRLRYDLASYGPINRTGLKNFLVPEHDFKFDLKATIGSDDSNLLGLGSYGVWIHTGIEYDRQGKEVFWTYMPNGKWEIMSPSVLQGNKGSQYVKSNLSHTLEYTDEYSVSEDSATCLITESKKDVLFNLTASDFHSRTVNFNTKNSIINVPLSYYENFEQVHRTNQKYIVEVFMYDTYDKTKFGIIDSISVQDSTQYNRAHHRHTFTYNDYEQAKDTMYDNFVFLDMEGGIVPSGTMLLLDSEGVITTSDGSKVTFKESNSYGDANSTVTLYSKISMPYLDTWTVDSNGQSNKFVGLPYAGPFTIGDDSNIIHPTGVSITGLVKGSNISREKTLYIPYSAEEVLAILREFNSLQQNLGARNKTISSPLYGAKGGSRVLYDIAPMWTQYGGHDTFVQNYNQYTDIAIDHGQSLGLRRVFFRNSDPVNFDGFDWGKPDKPTAGLPKYRQLTVYPDFEKAALSGIGHVYYDVNIDLDGPAQAGTEIAYTIKGTGTTNTYLHQTPWAIETGYESPLVLAAGDTSALIKVKLDASAGISTWNEYGLYFQLNRKFTKMAQPDLTKDDFRLYVKTKEVSAMNVAGGSDIDFSGCTIPPVLWFNTSSYSVASPGTPLGSTVVPIEGNIGGASGVAEIDGKQQLLPTLNEACRWYWAVGEGTTLTEGLDWLMCNELGVEVQQGDYLLTSGAPRIYVKVKGVNTGNIYVSGHYERVDLSSQGLNTSTFSFISRVHGQQWYATSSWESNRDTYDDPIWPGKSVSGGGGSWVSNSNLLPGSSRAASGIMRGMKFAWDPEYKDEGGAPLPIHYFTSSYMDPVINWQNKYSVPYIRTDLEGQLCADSRDEAFFNKRWALFYITHRDPSIGVDLPESRYGSYTKADNPPFGANSMGPARFARYSIRDKSANLQVSAGCSLDPQRCTTHTSGDSQAAVNFKRDSVTSGWEFDGTESSASGLDPEVSGGVVSGTGHDGRPEFTLWVLRDDGNSQERMDFAGCNVMVRPIKQDPALGGLRSGSWSIMSSISCAYNPFYQTYDSSAEGTPIYELLRSDGSSLPRFFPVYGDQWEPRGGLVVPIGGHAEYSHQFKIEVT